MTIGKWFARSREAAKNDVRSELRFNAISRFGLAVAFHAKDFAPSRLRANQLFLK
jgi:hypothetical protein